MISQTLLKKKAIEDCENHVKSLVSGELFVEAGESHLAWSPIELRHIFDQHMIVWRKCSAFEVVLDADDQPVGYLDEDKWADCAWAPLSHEEIVKLAADTGFVPEESGVLSMQTGPQDCLEATLSTDPEKTDAPRYVVRINPVRHRVISILPQEAVT